MLDAGQQVVQAMAELVEQGSDLVVGQQRRLAVHRRGEVAHQVGHRVDQPAWASRRRSRAPSIQAPPRLLARA